MDDPCRGPHAADSSVGAGATDLDATVAGRGLAVSAVDWAAEATLTVAAQAGVGAAGAEVTSLTAAAATGGAAMAGAAVAGAAAAAAGAAAAEAAATALAGAGAGAGAGLGASKPFQFKAVPRCHHNEPAVPRVVKKKGANK